MGRLFVLFCSDFFRIQGGEEVFLYQGKNTSSNVDLIAGDFWLNIYADSLNVGNDLLMGSGLSRYVALRKIVQKAQERAQISYDYVIVDLPPSFGALVRASFYSSDYYIVPCTSDNFSVYCVGLIGQMVPSFISDWDIGIKRFKDTNPHYSDFDSLGRPVFSGWIFNGFDTAKRRRTTQEIDAGIDFHEKEMIQADKTMHGRLANAISDDLVGELNRKIKTYSPVAHGLGSNYQIGDIEDANVLIQNSLWLNVPLGKLDKHNQVASLRDRRKWAENQIDQIKLFAEKFREAAQNLIRLCA